MDDKTSDAPMRVAKMLAHRGLASRREAETWIQEGRVTLDGSQVEVTTLVTDDDDVRVDGKPLPPAPPKVYYLLYKPRGYVTTRNDPQDRKTIEEFLDQLPHRVEAVGRLDVDTEGALLLTNDGEMAHRLTHPSTQVPKRYVVKVYRKPTEDKLDAIRKGKVHLDDGVAAPAKVRLLESTDSENTWVEITVTEGRNRLIRRIFQQMRHPVSKLRRESFATVSLRGLERGQIRRLTGEEVMRLRDLAAGVKPARAGKVKRSRKGFAKAKPKLGRPQARRRKAIRKRRG